jgi:hypothetical protein
VLDVSAILSLTEPARCHQDRMARLEMRDDLYRLLRTFEARHALPVADTTPEMQMRAALLATLRAYEDLHDLERSIPTLRSADKKRQRAA